MSVWHGSENVTDSTEDAIWNAAHTGMKSITLTTMGVLYSATYDCEQLKKP